MNFQTNDICRINILKLKLTLYKKQRGIKKKKGNKNRIFK